MSQHNKERVTKSRVSSCQRQRVTWHQNICWWHSMVESLLYSRWSTYGTVTPAWSAAPLPPMLHTNWPTQRCTARVKRLRVASGNGCLLIDLDTTYWQDKSPSSRWCEGQTKVKNGMKFDVGRREDCVPVDKASREGIPSWFGRIAQLSRNAGMPVGALM